MKEVKIAIEEPIFDKLREDVNQMLTNTIKMMSRKSTEDAIITVKIPVHIELKNIPDGGISREAPVPSFKHEISSIMQIREKMSGQSKGEYELVFDKDGNPMYRDINNGQTSIWDEDGLVDISEDSYAENDAKSLAAAPIRGIPEKATEEETAEEAEFEPVKDEPAAEEPEVASENPTKQMLPKPYKKGGSAPFEWLMQFRNQKMHIVKNHAAMTVRTEDDTIILSTLANEGNPFFITAERLAPHLEHSLICVTSPEEGNDVNSIEIWCDDNDCGDFIFGIDKPEEGDYEYEAPEA